MESKRLMDRRLDAAAISFAALLVVAPQCYLAIAQPNEDWTVLVYAVALPAILGSLALLALSRKAYLFAFLAYLWSVTDDAPVNLDSVYTWPEVTSGLQHTLTEILLHALTALFLYLAVREAFRGQKLTFSRSIMVMVLTVASLAAASISIIPLPGLQTTISVSWYPVDVMGHAISIGLICAVFWEARRK